MNATWDAQQREWLQAMGYEVMAPVGAATAAPAASVSITEQARGGSPGRTVSEAVDSMASAAWSDGPLLRALLRAARARDPQTVVDLLPSPDLLRGNPGAKRALWPRLRAFRRAHGH